MRSTDRPSSAWQAAVSIDWIACAGSCIGQEETIEVSNSRAVRQGG